MTDFISLEVLFKYFHSNRQILKAKLPKLSVTSAFCQHIHNSKLYSVIKWVRAACQKHGYPHPDSRDLMKKYVSWHNNVVCFGFLSLEIPLHCYQDNLVAFAYNTHFTGMYGKAKETAFVLFKDQFSLKIGIVFQGKKKEIVFQGPRSFLISHQWSKRLFKSNSELVLG